MHGMGRWWLIRISDLLMLVQCIMWGCISMSVMVHYNVCADTQSTTYCISLYQLHKTTSSTLHSLAALSTLWYKENWGLSLAIVHVSCLGFILGLLLRFPLPVRSNDISCIPPHTESLSYSTYCIYLHPSSLTVRSARVLYPRMWRLWGLCYTESTGLHGSNSESGGGWQMDSGMPYRC